MHICEKSRPGVGTRDRDSVEVSLVAYAAGG